jgi:hypothetical protein
LTKGDVSAKVGAISKVSSWEGSVIHVVTSLLKNKPLELNGYFIHHRTSFRAYVGKIDFRVATDRKELVQECDGYDIDGVVLAIVGQRLLPICRVVGISSTIRVLTPIYSNKNSDYWSFISIDCIKGKLTNSNVVIAVVL